MPYDLRSLVEKAGGTVRVAKACGVTPGYVSQWMKAGCLPLTEVKGVSNHAEKIIQLAGIKADEWEVRLIGRR